MSFLCGVIGQTLRDRVWSSVTRKKLGVEPLLLPIEVARVSVSEPLARLLGEVFRECPSRRRPRGGPRTHRGGPRTRCKDSSRLACNHLWLLLDWLEEVTRVSLLRLLAPQPNSNSRLFSSRLLSKTKSRVFFFLAPGCPLQVTFIYFFLSHDNSFWKKGRLYNLKHFSVLLTCTKSQRVETLQYLQKTCQHLLRTESGIFQTCLPHLMWNDWTLSHWDFWTFSCMFNIIPFF